MPAKRLAKRTAKPGLQSAASATAKPMTRAPAKPATKAPAKPATKRPAAKSRPRAPAKPATTLPAAKRATKPTAATTAPAKLRAAGGFAEAEVALRAHALPKPATKPPAAKRATKPAAAKRRATGSFAEAEAALRAHALAKPEATEHFPWGERAIKVKGKVFLFMRAEATQLSLSTKLPQSNGVALMLPFATPTGYGLGKAGWVSASFEDTDQPPVEMLCAWIDESYQAVAPARLAAVARGDAPR